MAVTGGRVDERTGALQLERGARTQAVVGDSVYRPVDRLLAGFLAIMSAVALARAGSDPGTLRVLPAYGLMLVLVWLVRRPGLGPVGQVLAEIYPMFLFVPIYGALDLLNAGAPGAVHDALVQRWEAHLFGGQISREWWQRAPSAFWSTVFHGAYFSYYVVVPLPAFYFTWRHDLLAIRRNILAVTVTFLFCYLIFVFFPVAGPYYEFPRPNGAFLDNPMARLVYGTLAHGSSFGAAFPSSHVAGMLASALTACIADRRFGGILLIPTALLTVGVVYCQMHYGVDALTGVVVGAGAVGLVWAWDRRRGPSRER